MKFKLGSLFDGIGGWPLAAERNGVIPVWASEIEPFPIKITSRHFPYMKQMGDVSKININDVEPVDIITMGSPCQDLSIAGKREGLHGQRSGLLVKGIELFKAMRKRENGKPRFLVWENVPGAFSSNHGEDFRQVLQEISETNIPMPRFGRWSHAGMVRSGKCEIAWRTLDAQYWGVPQRRKRIFLVADFGVRGASKVLFKPEGVSGDYIEGKEEGESNTSNIDERIACTNGKMIFENHSQDTRYVGPLKTSPTISAQFGTGGNNTPFVVEKNNSHAYSIAGNTIDRKLQNGGNGKGINKDVCFTLNTIDRHAIAYVVGNGQMHQMHLQEKAGALNCIHDQQAVLTNYCVRRLTPLECERLQGLPDNWTAGGSDMARYRAIGNGMAQPCADFIISRIASVLKGDL